MTMPKCDRCPLQNSCQKVGANHIAPAQRLGGVVIVSDQPDRSAVQRRLHNCDASAQPLIDALEANGKRRNDVGHVSVIQGQYPGMSRAKYKAASERKLGHKWGEKGTLSPEDACKPWFLEQVKGYKTIIGLGSGATRALVGNYKFTTSRGAMWAPEDTKVGKAVMLTWPLWHLRKEARFEKFFAGDIKKAFRSHRGELNWPKPTWHHTDVGNHHAVKTMCSSLIEKARRLGYVSWDIESAPMAYKDNGPGKSRSKVYINQRNPLRCAGFGWRDDVSVLAWRSVSGELIGTEKDRAVILGAIRTILEDPNIEKWGWNSAAYDTEAIHGEFGIQCVNTVDGMIYVKSMQGEYPASLAFWGARFTDAPCWKSGETGTEARNDYELWEYNAYDVAVTDEVIHRLRKAIEHRSMTWAKPASAKRHELQALLNQMSYCGIPIHEGNRQEYLTKYTKLTGEFRAAFDGVCALDNPGSDAQVTKLLFDTWGLPPSKWSDKTGLPSSDKEALISLLASGHLNEEQRVWVDNFRRWKITKRLLTNPLAPYGPSSLTTFRHPAGGWRLLPQFRGAGTKGGRISSDAQQLPRALKGLVGAPEGFLMVEADYTAGELAIIVHNAGIKSMKAATAKGRDLHINTAHNLWGDAIWELEGSPGGWGKGKGSGLFGKKRQLGKALNFGLGYNAGAKTFLGQMRQEMDFDYNLTNIDMTLEQASAYHTLWHRMAPEVKVWHEDLRERYRRDGFISDPAWGLRKYLPEGFEASSAANHEVQSQLGCITNDAMLILAEHPLWAPNPELGTGLVGAVHDSIFGLIREDDAEEALAHLKQVMPYNKGGLVIPIEGGIGTSLADLKDPTE